MGYTEVDKLAINTIRVLAVCFCCPSTKRTPPPPKRPRFCPTITTMGDEDAGCSRALAVPYRDEDVRMNNHLQVRFL